jgi:hypothetical protein
MFKLRKNPKIQDHFRLSPETYTLLEQSRLSPKSRNGYYTTVLW